LINQGFDVYTHKLEQPIPENISIVVVADPREMFSEVEMNHLRQFIARGGNMLITGEPRRNNILNSIINELGVEALPGIVVRDSKAVQADQIMARLTKPAAQLYHKLGNMYNREINVVMPGVSALKYTEDKGFKIEPLLTSDTDSTWIERQTVDFVEDTARFNPEKGEVEANGMPIITLLARDFAEKKQQKVVVMGSADCISNGEFSKGRNGIRSANYESILQTGLWFSDGNFPVNTNRPNRPDNQIKYVKYSQAIWIKAFFMGLIPALLALIGARIYIRRSRK
jgi:ABC-2 type transport system permease protein